MFVEQPDDCNKKKNQIQFTFMRPTIIFTLFSTLDSMCRNSWNPNNRTRSIRLKQTYNQTN
jgi:hypothetical protein